MNKLRLIKIYELRGEIHPIEQYIINILETMEIENNINSITYKIDGHIHIYYQKYDCGLSHGFILKSFNCSDEETQVVTKYLLEKHLKIKINKIW